MAELRASQSGVAPLSLDDEPKERRRYRRKPVLWSGRIETPRRVVPCMVVEVSLAGAKLRLLEPVDDLDLVTLVLEQFGKFASKVAWRTGIELGLRFLLSRTEIEGRFGGVLSFEYPVEVASTKTLPSDIENDRADEASGGPTLAKDVPWDWVDRGWEERREYARKPVVLAATLEAANGVFECLTVDLSHGGARLHLVETIDTRQPVVLILAEYGRFEARVAWRATAEIGLKFSAAPEEVARRLAGIL